MELLSGLQSILDLLTGYALPFLFVLTVVVFVHELGHFLVARLCGVRVLTFSIGFGPEIAGFFDKSGTRWRFAAIPLGGYVKFLGDENAASAPDHETLAALRPDERRMSFAGQPVAKRAAIVAAGPFANFVLAIVVFAAIFMFSGRLEMAPIVDRLQPGSAAEAAGFLPGDKIVAIDGRPIRTFSDMQRIVSGSAGVTLEIEVERDGARVPLTATPQLREIQDGFGGTQRVGVLGISRSTADSKVVTVQRYGFFDAVALGAEETWFVVTRTGQFLAGLVAGRESADQLGGPLRIAQVSGQVANAGVAALFNLVAVLSVSIGLLNLVPIPMLDGGHLLFYGVEALRGRPLSERAQEMGLRIGLALVLMLMLFATWNDIVFLSSLG
jgi:regulator of sigma E protease